MRIGRYLPNRLRRCIARLWCRWIGDEELIDLMIAYEAKFPGRCGFCGYLRATNQRPFHHSPCKEVVEAAHTTIGDIWRGVSWSHLFV